MRKIRCTQCGHILAMEIKPFTGEGTISIMCNNRKSDGKRCKSINIIGVTDPNTELNTTINQ